MEMVLTGRLLDAHEAEKAAIAVKVVPVADLEKEALAMAEKIDTAVSVATTADRLPDGVMAIRDVPADVQPGCRVFVHYNGPTDQLAGLCACAWKEGLATAAASVSRVKS